MTLTEQQTAIRRATIEDRAEVTRVLAAAFLDDPVFAWVVPDRPTC